MIEKSFSRGVRFEEQQKAYIPFFGKNFRFTIGAVVLALSFGQLYATFDGKWLFIISTVLFQAASALCGGAPNMSAMIIGRVLAGVGGNGMYLGTLTLMILHTREKERSGYLALM